MAIKTVSGVICTKGIIVNDAIYSCSKAIKEQWFLKVLETGTINVVVYLDSKNPSEVFLPLSTGCYLSCLCITKSEVPEESLQIYFDHIERLKHAYRNRNI